MADSGANVPLGEDAAAALKPHKSHLKCVVVTPETTVLDTVTDFVAFPAYDGEVGILPGHSPLVARLGPGELRVRSEGGEPERFYVDGGFGQVHGNVVSILTPRAKRIADLQSEEIEKQLAKINTEVPTTLDSHADKYRRLQSARAQLRLSRR